MVLYMRSYSIIYYLECSVPRMYTAYGTTCDYIALYNTSRLVRASRSSTAMITSPTMTVPSRSAAPPLTCTRRGGGGRKTERQRARERERVKAGKKRDFKRNDAPKRVTKRIPTVPDHLSRLHTCTSKKFGR